MHVQQFIIGTKYFGTAPRTYEAVHGTVVPPSSYAYFCPVCAEVWARCPVTSVASGKVSRFQVLTLTCGKHTNTEALQIPGSLFLSWDRAYSEAFPEELIRYELTQALNLYKDIP